MFLKQLGKYTKAHRVNKNRDKEENQPPNFVLPTSLFSKSHQKTLSSSSATLSSKKLGTPTRTRMGGVSPLRKQFESLNTNKSQDIEYNYQSTPSLLKSKVLNKSQKSGANSLDSSCAKVMCQNANHGERGATYVVVGDNQERLYYCQKCAILLASQGFAVLKLNTQESLSDKQQQTQQFNLRSIKSSERRAEIMQFLHQLQQLGSKIRQKQEALDDQKVRSLQHYASSESLINNYFDSLQQLLQRKRKMHLEAIKQSLQSQTQAFEIQRLGSSCQRIKDDIVGSVRNINLVENDVYSKVMKMYWNKLQQYDNQVEVIQVEEPTRNKIVLKGVSLIEEQIQSIIDIRFQNPTCYYGQKGLSHGMKNKSFSFDNGGEQEQEKYENQGAENYQNVLTGV